MIDNIMYEVINWYLSCQISICIIVGILYFTIKLKGLDSKKLLKLTYLAIVMAIILPIFFVSYGESSFFAPLVRKWNSDSADYMSLPSTSAIGSTHISMGQDSETNKYQNLDLETMVFFIWLLPSLIFFIKLLQSWRLTLTTLRNSYPLKKIGKAELYVSETISGPFSFYCGKNTIVIPYKMFSDFYSVKLILKHEIQHIRQGDTLAVYFLEFMRVIFFLNPAVHVLFHHLALLQETSCDEVVINSKGIKLSNYIDCIFKILESKVSEKSLTGAVGFLTEKQQIKRRLNMISKRKFKSKFKSKFLAWVSLVVVIPTVCISAWAFSGLVKNQGIKLEELQKIADSMNKTSKILIQITPKVHYWVNQVLVEPKNHKHFVQALERMDKFKPLIGKKLEDANLPLELLAVPIVESHYRENAKSSAGAAGLWQFISKTATRYGLTVSSQVDERYNLTKATDAAISYYKGLHAIFNNWHIALSAYNVGERRMLTEISKAGHNDVLAMNEAGVLGTEGSNYLPKVLAAMILVENRYLLK